MLIGGIVGLQVGWIGLQLPLIMPLQGLVAVLILMSVLRVRRYLYDPRPSHVVAWMEGAAAVLFLVGTLAMAKWV